MKVGLVHRYFWRAGAVPTVAREWAGHLEAGGHEVVVFASDVESAQSTPRRRYVRVRAGRWKAFDLGGFLFALRLFGALWRRRRERPDVLLVVDSTAYFGAWLAGQFLRVPAVMAFQGWVYSPGKRGIYPRTVTWVYKLSVHFCIRFAPLIGCLSREIHDGLLAKGVAPERLWFAPNCVDLALWRTGKEGAHRRAERGVLYVGRFSVEKGLRFLLEAAPAVLQRCPNTRFRLVGSEEPEDGEYHELARRLGVRDRVEFAGTVPRESLPAVYADADVLAVPSLAEGHALAPLESVACGTPVVGSDIPGIRETIEEGVNGLLVPPGDAAALADALARVLGDADLLDRLTRAARPSAQRFSWETRIAEFPALCATLPRRKPRHA
jgi:glycosyltransferase involved in cell wall biosynthesis